MNQPIKRVHKGFKPTNEKTLGIRVKTASVFPHFFSSCATFRNYYPCYFDEQLPCYLIKKSRSSFFDGSTTNKLLGIFIDFTFILAYYLITSGFAPLGLWGFFIKIVKNFFIFLLFFLKLKLEVEGLLSTSTTSAPTGL